MRGRPKIKRTIGFMPEITYFKPAGIPLRYLTEVILTVDEIEAIRLAELDDLDQETAAKKMGISRVTFLRILHKAHKKIAEGLIYGKAIKIEGGEIMAFQKKLDKKSEETLKNRRGQGLGGSSICICPICKKEYPHERKVPCIQVQCPDCKVPLRGSFCR